MNVTRNGQSVAFEVNASGDLEQISPYASKAGDPNREYVAYRVEDVIVIAQDRFLARQALKQHRVELVEAMRAELDADPIRRVRKDGSTKVATRAEAVALVAAAEDQGYHFGQAQEFAGFVVRDLDA